MQAFKLIRLLYNLWRDWVAIMASATGLMDLCYWVTSLCYLGDTQRTVNSFSSLLSFCDGGVLDGG